MRFVLPLLALGLLAGCGDENGAGASGNAAATAPAGSVAATPAPAGQQWVDVVERTPEGGYRMGNPNAAIKLVEFGSRTCHVCQAFDEQAMDPLKANYIATGKVSYEFRDYLRNGADIAAALVGQCGGTGPFFAMLDQMYAEQAATLARAEKLPQSFYSQLEGASQAQQPALFAEAIGYIDFAKQRGLPEAQVRQCLSDTAKAQALADANEKATADFNIQGTPTFLLNGAVLPNTVNWQQVEAALKNAGA